MVLFNRKEACAQALGTSEELPEFDPIRWIGEPLRTHCDVSNDAGLSDIAGRRHIAYRVMDRDLIIPGLWLCLLCGALRLFLFLEEPTMKKSKKRKAVNYSRMRCPYCGSPVIFRSAEGIYKDNRKNVMLYVCSGYPACNSYVRVHEGTRVPVGELADPKLRSLRRQAHAYFDQLHLSGLMSKQVAYQWLSNITCTPLKRAHIGFLREYNCQLVIDESRKLLDMKHIPYPREKEARRYGPH